MQSLHQLVKVLDKIQKVSEDILSEGLDIMKELKNDDNPIIEEIMKSFEAADKKQSCLEFARNISITLIQDAKTVKTQLPIFASALSSNTPIDDCKAPFFVEIWCGDAYGKTEYDGLVELEKDLRSQLQKVSRDRIITEVLEIHTA